MIDVNIYSDSEQSSRSFSWKKDERFSPKKWCIYIDGSEWHRISTSIITKEIDLERIKETFLVKGDSEAELLFKEIEYSRAYIWAIKQLSMRSMFEKDIEKAMQRHSVSEDTIELILQKLRLNGYVNDKDKLSSKIESMRLKGKSTREISQKIRLYNVSEEISDIQLFEEENTLKHDEKALISFMEKEFKRAGYHQPVSFQEKQKLIQKCMRRGFSYDLINVVLAQYKE